jgi:hypothetical protein
MASEDSKPMTKAARRRYIASAGTSGCPYCEAPQDDFDYEEPDFVEDGDIEQIAQCPTCDRRWKDVFRLVEVRELCS